MIFLVAITTSTHSPGNIESNTKHGIGFVNISSRPFVSRYYEMVKGVFNTSNEKNQKKYQDGMRYTPLNVWQM